jgi:hypothetical protein
MSDRITKGFIRIACPELGTDQRDNRRVLYALIPINSIQYIVEHGSSTIVQCSGRSFLALDSLVDIQNQIDQQ